MPRFKPGDKKPENSGRRKGVKNKSTTANKDLIQSLIDGNSDKVQDWLDRTAVRRPDKALDLYIKLAEFVIPKAKIEVEMNSRVITVDIKDE